ncbi:MAG: R2-like ligand-binding oxidase [Chloroflexota bacterium]|nr:R2-like ligand-binding oxidase [Anaerolineales bacterium]MCA9975801.1 R2-like ligand-binding oxidase [Anaerolineales bacterium]MCB8965485.1 R2-like ligand-binding oxidase [Ardenticatenaceae bacterium]
MTHDMFITTSRGLQRNTPPMRLYEKAKKFGIWNPSDIDFTQDKLDWRSLSDAERDVLLRLTAMFQAGEEAVTLDLLPLIMVIAQEGRIEEEMYLTTFLFEEAKHTDFFNRFLTEVAAVNLDLRHYHGPDYHTVFYEALPTALQRLQQDSSPAAQVQAAVTYNMIVEGVLAETGYHAYSQALQRNNLLPGQQQGITLLKQDESRHIAYGVFLISRLMAADPTLWDVVEATMNDLLMPALAVVGDVFEQYDPMPFGLQQDDFIDYATNQFNKRIERIEKARGASLEEVYRVTQQAIEAGDS